MTKATGVYKEVRFKKNTGAWGDLAGSSGGKKLRRVTADFNPTADTYTSNEITPTFQITDVRIGVRGVEGSLKGELSPGSYSDFVGSVLARDFAAVTGASGLSVTIAASGSNFTITRGSGSFLTDGIKVGQVVRMTGAGLNAANVGNNCLVLSMTATVLTVKVLSSTALVAEGPIASVAVAPAGSVSYVPSSGHTDQDYNIEEWHSDISQSALYTGVKVGSVKVAIPSTGIMTVDLSFTGKGLMQEGTSAYFTAPSAATTTGLLTAVQGVLVLNGSTTVCVTDANISIDRTLEKAQCLGNNYNSNIFTGKIGVTGSLSAYFEDATLRNYFNNETDVTLILVATAGADKNSDFISFVLPKIQLTSFSNADKETGIISSLNFTAVMNTTTTAGLIDSTIMIQDSAA